MTIGKTNTSVNILDGLHGFWDEKVATGRRHDGGDAVKSKS